MICTEGENAYPRECCGFLLGSWQGTKGTVKRVLRARNDHRSPGGYTISPQAYLEAETVARREHQTVIGFYHSHPDTDARPSETDRRHALPGCAYVIVSVKGGRATDLKAWTLSPDGSRLEPEPLG